MHVRIEKVTQKAMATTYKDVVCQFCGVHYHYACQCMAEGHGHTLYGINREGVEARAQELAQRKAKAWLHRGIAPVACPGCGKLQDEMIVELRRRMLKKYQTAGWTIPGVLAAFIVSLLLLVEPLTTGWVVGIVGMAATAALMCGFFGVRIWSESRTLSGNHFGRMPVSTGTRGPSPLHTISHLKKQ